MISKKRAKILVCWKLHKNYEDFKLVIPLQKETGNGGLEELDVFSKKKQVDGCFLLVNIAQLQCWLNPNSS